ncbi:hypothetical protein EYF88_02855 [Paracoccus sediminis]|uniref:Uncharacterized protein n=1 Tax=Paracoccus sediminis TaxID=1214787 RepID=A0A238UL62_9RHOB|nr:putative Ig domain-containing protein [Paracoccus sediminis]TBN53150.1 hypothetical protein EYF88_02855 [Paracoccus sediminis]SNR22790.1 hypothetical protein SAMN06265378_10153 [Paracoccus sediminis]
MVNRIIITDGNWDSDTLILLPRPTLPHTLDLPAGDYVVVNTASNPDPATATDPPAQNGSPSATAPATDTLTVGAAYSADFRSRFSDPDGDPLIFAMTGTPPPGIARTNAAFAGTPTTAGSYSVTLTGSDPSGAFASIGIS